MLGFARDGVDQVEHLVISEQYSISLIHSAAVIIFHHFSADIALDFWF